MKRYIALATTVLVSSFVTATGARAQLTVASGPSCSAFDGFLFSTATSSGNATSYVRCGGAFVGNDAGALLPDVLTYLGSEWGFYAPYAGSTEAGSGGLGPFGAFDDEMTALELTFDDPIAGLFVLSLKTAGGFSLYQFDTGGETWTSLFVGTDGVSTNRRGMPQALSHGSLFFEASTVAPEPGTVVLLGTGLLGLGLVGLGRRRREDEKV